jgi:hypothetical protein
MEGKDVDKIFGGDGRQVLWCEGRWNIYIQPATEDVTFCNLLHACEGSDHEPTNMEKIGLQHPDAVAGFTECEACHAIIPKHVQTLMILYCTSLKQRGKYE